MSDRDFSKVGEFAILFALATVKLRNANDAGEGCELSAEEVSVLVDALKILAAHNRDSGE